MSIITANIKNNSNYEYFEEDLIWILFLEFNFKILTKNIKIKTQLYYDFDKLISSILNDKNLDSCLVSYKNNILTFKNIFEHNVDITFENKDQILEDIKIISEKMKKIDNEIYLQTGYYLNREK